MVLRKLVICLVLLGCGEGSTAILPPDLDTRLNREGVLRRAADLTFRYTEAPGRRSARWENRDASIVVTPSTILIHKRSKIGLEITPRSRRQISVEREGRRVRLRTGEGRSEVLWSFEPPDGDVAGWTRDLRAVTKQMKAADPPRH
jgi:hypothetical protein